MNQTATMYRACGFQAGRAILGKQRHLAQYFNHWLLRAMMQETESNRRKARDIFNDALAEQLRP